MKSCHYCQKPVKRGQKTKTIYSRMTNVETGKSLQFLDNMYFHIECYAQLEETRRRLIAESEAKGIKVTWL